MSIYEELILDHYQFPHNKGVLDDADAQCTLSNPTCGDTMTMTIQIKNDHVTACQFNGHACAISTASASLLTDAIVNMSIAHVRELTAQDVLNLLQIELSPIRLKCALLPLEGIQTALANLK